MATFADHLCLLCFFDRPSMNKTDSDGFFSRWLVCRSSDRSYNSTGWSLVIVNCQLSFLTLASRSLAILYCIVYMWHARALSYSYVIACIIKALYSCGYSRHAHAIAQGDNTGLHCIYSSTSCCCLRVLLPTSLGLQQLVQCTEGFAQGCFIYIGKANCWLGKAPASPWNKHICSVTPTLAE